MNGLFEVLSIDDSPDLSGAVARPVRSDDFDLGLAGVDPVDKNIDNKKSIISTLVVKDTSGRKEKLADRLLPAALVATIVAQGLPGVSDFAEEWLSALDDSRIGFSTFATILIG